MVLDTACKYHNYIQSVTDMLRLVLYEGEVFRLPTTFKEIRILSGRAWLTINGEDITLGQGQEIDLSSQKGFALISALYDTPLVIEAKGENKCH